MELIDKMKILYFLAHPEGIGGANKVLMTQALIMKERGNDIRVVIQDDIQHHHCADFDVFLNDHNIDFVSLYYPIATCMEEIDILGSRKSSFDIDNMITEFSPNIIHSVQINIAVETSARRMKVPHLMNVYPVLRESFSISWEKVYPRYHCGDSEFYCNRWKVGLGIESRCIRIMYEKSNVTKNHYSREHKYELVSIGGFYQYKNQQEIIKFVEKCVNEDIDVRLTFYGDDKTVYATKCKEYVRMHNLESNVIFAGFTNNIEEAFYNKDAFVHASLAESFPGVLVEAMANKVPIIVNAISGIPELMIDGKNCIYMDTADSDGIFLAFSRLINMKSDTLSVLIENAFSTYHENCTGAVIGNQLEKYYEDIIMSFADKFEEDTGKEAIDSIIKWSDEIGINELSACSRSHTWLLYHISLVVKHWNYKTSMVWGACEMGKAALEWIELLQLDMKGYIDSNRTGKFSNYDIVSPSEMEDVDVIFVAVTSYVGLCEITKYLNEKGRVRNINYFIMNNTPCV